MLPRGAVSALRALRHRVPPGTPEPLAEAADEALEAMVTVMRGDGGRAAFSMLAAAKAVRDEVCGPATQKHEVSGPGGEPLTVVIREFKPEQGEE